MINEDKRSKATLELYNRTSSEFYDYYAKRGDVKFYTDAAFESGNPALE